MDDVQKHLSQKIAYKDLPKDIRQTLSINEYKRLVLDHCLANAIPYPSCSEDVASVYTPKQYLRLIMDRSVALQQVYPYRFMVEVIEDLSITPFDYYTKILLDNMKGERSYDTLPNFTAVDTWRMMGIGRNQYIDIMNSARSKRMMWKMNRGFVRQMLPQKMAATAEVQPWWQVKVVPSVSVETLASNPALTPADLVAFTSIQRAAYTPMLACEVPRACVHALYHCSAIYTMVPLSDEDIIVVPTLQEFIMNRTTSDPMEKLLYDLLVAVDDRTSMQELSMMLAMDVDDIKAMVGIYLRLGLAHKKNAMRSAKIMVTGLVHESWGVIVGAMSEKEGQADIVVSQETFGAPPPSSRVAVLFDATLTAYLMMGNLGSIKEHAITMFETGKLTHENVNSFLEQLKAIKEIPAAMQEGEAHKYFEAAYSLRSLLSGLRGDNYVVDLLKLESLEALDPATRFKMLHKSYRSVIALSPLQPITFMESCPVLFGATVPLLTTPWMLLYLHTITRHGPRAYVFGRGMRIRRIPKVLSGLHITVLAWGQTSAQPQYGAPPLCTLNHTLRTAPCYVSGTPALGGVTVNVPFSGSVERCSIPPASLDVVLAARDRASQVLRVSHSLGTYAIHVGVTTRAVIVGVHFGIPIGSSVLAEDTYRDGVARGVLEPSSCAIHRQNMDRLEKDVLAFVGASTGSTAVSGSFFPLCLYFDGQELRVMRESEI